MSVTTDHLALTLLRLMDISSDRASDGLCNLAKEAVQVATSEQMKERVAIIQKRVCQAAK